MPFQFTWLCDLLEQLEKPLLTTPPNLLPEKLKEYTEKHILEWFHKNRHRLNANDTEADAVTCMLRPETWVGREYFGDEEKLEPLLAKVLRLTDTEGVELHRWKTAYYTGDMGAQVERIWGRKKYPNCVLYTEVTVEDIDQFFLKTAAHNPRSSLEVQFLRPFCDDHDADNELKVIFGRLRPRDAKWMTRLLLKTTDPVKYPASFQINPNKYNHASCVKPFPFEISDSPPTALRFGSKRIKAQKPVVPSSTPRLANTITRRRSPTLERGGSPETDLRPSERGRRNSRGLKSLNRSVSRPRTTKANDNGYELPESISTPPSSSPMSLAPAPNKRKNSDPRPAAKRQGILRDISPGSREGYLKPTRPTNTSQGTIQTPPSSLPKPLGPAPNASENSDSLPVAKRQRMLRERESSPGTYVFKRGILGPIRETNISNNHSLSKNLANAKAPRDSLSQEKSPQNRPSFPLANSSQPRMPPGSNCVSSDALQPAPEKGPNNYHDHQSRSKVVSPTVILEDNIQSNETLLTPASSDPAPHSLHGKTNTEADTAEMSQPGIGIQVQLEDVPKLSIENPQDPSLVVPSPLPKWLPLSTTIPNSPMIIGGAGRCTISVDLNAKRCPLTNCIFLPSPYLPADVIDSLKTFLFAHHGSRYVTNVKDLGHASLPHRCQVTGTNYRKIVLIEPSDIDETDQVIREVQDLDLKRNGRKFWTEFFHWRLLGDIGSNEWGEEVQGNPWTRCCRALE